MKIDKIIKSDNSFRMSFPRKQECAIKGLSRFYGTVPYLCLLSFLLLFAPFAHAVTLEIPDLQVPEHQQDFQVDLNIMPGNGEDISALNYEITFDDAVLNFDSIDAGSVSNQAGKSVFSSVRAPGRVRVLVLGINQNMLLEGQLAILTFDVRNGVGRTETTVSIEGPIAVQPNGDDTYAVQVVNGSIRIGNIQTEIMYVHLNGKRIAHQDEDSTFFYHNDHLGSPVVVSDQFADKVRYIEYFPFGDTKQEIPGNSRFADKKVKFKYNSKELDESTGFYDYGARQYDPKILRFISADPLDWKQEIESDGNIDADEINNNIRDIGFLGDPQNLNRYTYTLNNPLKYVDPDGFLAEPINIAPTQITKPIADGGVLFKGKSKIMQGPRKIPGQQQRPGSRPGKGKGKGEPKIRPASPGKDQAPTTEQVGILRPGSLPNEGPHGTQGPSNDGPGGLGLPPGSSGGITTIGPLASKSGGVEGILKPNTIGKRGALESRQVTRINQNNKVRKVK